MLMGAPLPAGEAVQCRVRFSVGADATTPTALTFHASPRECHTDLDWSNNSARFVFGNPLPATISVLSARDAHGLPGLTLVVVGMLALAGWHGRR